jgi:hypothetical protein
MMRLGRRAGVLPWSPKHTCQSQGFLAMTDSSNKRSAAARNAKKTPKRRDPWEIPEAPAPEAADENIAAVYAAVGAALSAWERMEESLAQLFSIFIGLHSGSIAAERAYGSVSSFVSRRVMIEQAAEVYFRDHPDAKSQAVFDDIVELAEGFYARRNDIAHAKAMSFLRQADGKFIFLLWPAFYNSNKVNWRGTAKFVYNSMMIAGFTNAFDEIAQKVRELTRQIEERHALERAPEAARPVYE